VGHQTGGWSRHTVPVARLQPFELQVFPGGG
jgi:hypothetical protein